MTKIGIIIGSTRPGRNGEAVAKWVYEQASLRSDANFELVDLLDFNLPHLDEIMPPSFGQYANEHTKRWAAKIAEFDGFVFVTPEYNHSTSGSLKNAIDYLYGEWNNKAAAIVSYGSLGGTRAAEHLRLILGELQIADVRNFPTHSHRYEHPIQDHCPYRRQETRPDPRRRRLEDPRPRRAARHQTRCRLRLRPHRDRRPLPPGLHQDPRRRKGPTCAAFLTRAAAFYATHGITVERVPSDKELPHRPDLPRHRRRPGHPSLEGS